ncbi:MAG: type II toxin-antitoxin system Phd/YefM family antitoxin [Ignavibacteriales bacterium]|jgi:prevent-host-death family protein|nr:type II toxin-antitoxin system Phd/YefM family antitoxin [Ignavibacteriales bacterium]
MKNISVTNDIIPVGQFKSGLAKYLKDIQVRKHSLVITQNGKPAGVLVSPTEYDSLNETKLFIESISRGLADSENGDLLTTAQLKSKLKKYRASKS